MRVSQLIGKRFKEKPSECVTEGHALLIRGGYIKQVSSGIYSGYHAYTRMTKKIEAIVREEMDSVGGQEISLPLVLPAALWKVSGRYDKVDRELLRFKDRNQTDMVLAMTHEEAILDLVNEVVEGEAQYPFMIYQIQTKYRDEARPRAGLIRVREFTMKDAYSFHLDVADLKRYYDLVKAAYVRLFKRVGLDNVVVVESGSGIMGGDVSHEFMAITPIGEDKLSICSHCGYGKNLEDADLTNCHCPKCGGETLEAVRGIEVGNIFQLGDVYTKSMGLSVKTADEGVVYPVMGCYGIGIGRMIGTLAESCRDEKGIIWPEAVAPWRVQICLLNDKENKVRALSDDLYEKLVKAKVEVLYDERDLRAGAMFAEADLMGIPYRIVMSKKTLEDGCVEWSNRTGTLKERVPLEEVIDRICSL